MSLEAIKPVTLRQPSIHPFNWVELRLINFDLVEVDPDPLAIDDERELPSHELALDEVEGWPQAQRVEAFDNLVEEVEVVLSQLRSPPARRMGVAG
ncbi:MAG: hypothetical protein ACRDJU_13035 [Actinomycetota bacterium]